MNDKKWNFLNYTLVWMDKFDRQTDRKTVRKITKKLTVLITRQIERGRDKTFKYTKLTFSIHISIHILTLKLILLVIFFLFFSSPFMDFPSIISVTLFRFVVTSFFWPFLIGFGFNSSQCQWDNRLEY